MTKNNFVGASVLAGVLSLMGCGGSGGSGGSTTQDTTRATYLNVDISEFYFGAREIGTSTAQTIELTNWSGDLYPLNKLTINGQDAAEFGVDFHGGITLGPSQKIALSVSFAPITEGVKNAELDVDYEVIPQVTAADNRTEQVFYAAAAHEDKREYKQSLEKYQQYLDSQPKTVNRKRAAIKLPVMAESTRYGSGRDFRMYVAAMNHRDDGDYAKSLAVLDKMIATYPSSYLADDAMYLKAYMQLIDFEDYRNARWSFAALRTAYPESSYQDTALYAEGLALEELGQQKQAVERYQLLNQRHQSPTMAAININVAKDNFVSRLWFERARRGIERASGQTEI